MLTLIKEYGALICVTVTTCRKAVTIILSFILFSKPFVFEYVGIFYYSYSYLFFISYVWSGLIVVIGIYLNVYSRNQAAFNATIASYANRLFGFRFGSKLSTPTASRTLPV